MKFVYGSYACTGNLDILVYLVDRSRALTPCRLRAQSSRRISDAFRRRFQSKTPFTGVIVLEMGNDLSGGNEKDVSTVFFPVVFRTFRTRYQVS